MITTLSPIQQLDYVLDYLATNDFAQQPLTDIQILVDLKDNHNFEFQAGDFHRIINKLVDEKYVTKQTVDNIPYYLKETQPPSFSDVYQISFDGRLFNQRNGYGQKLIDEKQDRINEERQMGRMESNAVRLVVWTRLLAFATIFAVLLLISWELVKHYLLCWD